MDFDSLTSLLFTPANHPERFLKAKEIGSSGIIIDLEDAIGMDHKNEARETVLQFLASFQSTPDFLTAVRINSIRTAYGVADIQTLLSSKHLPDALVLPKVESVGEIAVINELFFPRKIDLIVMIESAIGLGRIRSIACSSPNVKALFFGGADLSNDLGAEFDWEPLLYARSCLVQAAKEAKLIAIDVPYLHLADPDDSGLEKEAKRIKSLGFTAKASIHPKHIAAINQVFRPTDKEVENAKGVVNVYEKAKGQACEYSGKMIDKPIYDAAQTILKRIHR